LKSIIDCFSEVLPASDVPFDRLHGRVTKKKLNLLEAREMFNTDHDDISPVEEYLLRKHESLPRTRSRLRYPYAAFFYPALIFAQRARIAAAIFLRAAADMVWGFAGADPVGFAAPTTGFDSFRPFAHLAF